MKKQFSLDMIWSRRIRSPPHQITNAAQQVLWLWATFRDAAMRTLRGLTFTLAGAVIFSLASCSSKRPEQLNLVLRLNKDRPDSVSEIVESIAHRTGLTLTSYKNDLGDGRGMFRAYLINDWRTHVMISSAYEGTCGAHPINSASDANGIQRYSNDTYVFTIAQTTIFNASISFKEMEGILVAEAEARGGVVLTAWPDCQIIRPKAISEK